MFKWIGLILGFLLLSTMSVGLLFLGVIGAIIGLLMGGFADRIRSFGIGGANPFTNKTRQAVFLETAFVLMGKLAKADGRISQVEVDHVEAFIKKLGMSGEHRQEAIRQFQRGAEAGFNIDETLVKFNQYCGNTFNLKQMLLVYLTVMALADGKLDPAEQTILEQVSAQLGYSKAEFNRILSMIMSQANFSSGRQYSSSSSGPRSASEIDDAYTALGVSKNSTDQEVKRAYRKLMSQYHPDKLMGQGVPEDMINVATEKTKEIQLAYDLIKKQRGL
ncbi:MAG TPA: co-chaperone DjlA [Methylophaga aminisulfidivorans]|nr:co-chaperone DjlA [Methylophaga aminisulfidivorans]